MSLLIIKTSALGDVVQALEALTWLVSDSPTSHPSIGWIVERSAAPLVTLHPAIDRVHIIDSRSWRAHPLSRQTWKEIAQLRAELKEACYQVAVDLQGNLKSTLCRWLAKGKRQVGYSSEDCAEWPASFGLHSAVVPDLSLGARGVYAQLLTEAFFELSPGKTQLPELAGDSSGAPVKRRLSWRFNSEVLQRSQEFLDQGAYGLIALGSRWPHKQIPVEIGVAIAKCVLEQRPSERLCLVWDSEPQQRVALQIQQTLPHLRIELLPRVELLLLTRLVQQARWLISADSLPLHLASWMGTASFGLFGPSASLFYGSRGARDAHWQGSCPYGQLFVKRCPQLRSCATGACIKAATAQPLLQRLSVWLKRL